MILSRNYPRLSRIVFSCKVEYYWRIYRFKLKGYEEIQEDEKIYYLRYNTIYS